MRFKHFLIPFLLTMFSSPVYAGVLATGSLEWKTLALRPLDTEPTPNYFGYGLDVSFGYSLARVIDLGVYAEYVPMRLKSAKAGAGDLQTYNFGGVLGFRMGEIVYVGLRGGQSTYRLKKLTKPEEQDGDWAGFGGEIEVSAVSKISKESYGQFGIRLGSGTLKRIDETAEKKRTFDTFAVTMTYVFNVVDSVTLGNSFISDFVDSLIF